MQCHVAQKCFEMVVNARLHSCCTEDLFSTSHHGRTCRRCHHFQGETWSPPLKPNISTQNDAMFEAVSIHLPKHQIGMLSMLVFWGKATFTNFWKSRDLWSFTPKNLLTKKHQWIFQQKFSKDYTQKVSFALGTFEDGEATFEIVPGDQVLDVSNQLKNSILEIWHPRSRTFSSLKNGGTGRLRLSFLLGG